MPATLTSLRALGVIALGLFVGTVGTGIHRASAPAGLILALATAASAGVLVRAWTGWRGVPLLAGALLVAILVLSLVRPGGDVVVAAEDRSYWWFASVPVVLATLALPKRWFSERQIGRAADRDGLAP